MKTKENTDMLGKHLYNVNFQDKIFHILFLKQSIIQASEALHIVGFEKIENNNIHGPLIMCILVSCRVKQN